MADDIAVLDQHRVRWLATRFRAFEMLTAEDVHAVFDPSGEGESVPASAKREYFLCVACYLRMPTLFAKIRKCC